jgi:DNA recombination protein RmuC
MNLGRKAYQAQFDPSPDFVVLFLPGDAFYSAALEQDPSLIELGVDQNVLISTPTDLIGLLRTIASGWRQEALAQNAKEVSELGKELYKRLSTVGEHFAKLGKHLTSATKAYNSTVTSLESRVLVSARKFDDLHVTVNDKPLEILGPIEQIPRQLQAPEMLEDAAAALSADGADFQDGDGENAAAWRSPPK